MDARRAKQAIYGVFYLLVFGLFATGFYFTFIHEAASCFDNTQNQKEEGVDCGGPCAKICIPQSIGISLQGDLSVFNIYPERSSLPIHYTALARILNTNAGFASPSFGFRLDFYDLSGALVKTTWGRSFIYGGEVKYIIAPNLDLPAPVASTTITIVDPSWVPASELGLVPQLKAQVTGSSVASTTVTVNGELKDADVSAFDSIIVIALFKDQYNNVIGATQTLVDKIGPNETRFFSVVYPARPGLDPARTEFFPYALRH